MKKSAHQAAALIVLLGAVPAYAQVATEANSASQDAGTAQAPAERENERVEEDAQADGDTHELPELLVTAQRQRTEGSGSYAPVEVTAGSKTAEDWASVPRSVSVLTRQQIEDQGFWKFERAVDQLPGVTLDLPEWGIGGAGFYSRGYQISNVAVDGGAANFAMDRYLNVQPSLEFYDSIQLLRGPDALFSGNGTPAGSINLLRKRPTDTLVQQYTLSAGSWDTYGAVVDVGGPLTRGGGLRARAVASQHDNRAFWSNSNRRRTSLYALFEADLSDSTLLTFGANRNLARGQGFDAAPAMPRHSNGQPIDLPRSLGLPGDVYFNGEDTEVFVGLEQQLSERWRLRFNASRKSATSDFPLAVYWGGSDAASNSGSTLYRWCCFDYEFRGTAMDLNVQGDFDLFGREHRLLVGVDNRRGRGGMIAPWDTDPTEYYPIGNWRDWDPDNLDYGFSHTDDVFWWRRQKDRERGIYATTRWQLSDRLRAFIGGRYSSYRGQWGEAFFASSGEVHDTRRNDDIFLPYYGLTYAINPSWSAYSSLSYSTEDQSNNYTPELQPMTTVASGQNLELGVKGTLASGLNLAFAVYRMDRDDVAQRVSSPPDFNMPGLNCCFAPIGKYRSQGAEIEVTGEVLPGWQLSGGFTFDDNTTEFGTASGERLVTFAPRRQLKLWSRYQLPWADQRFALGGGVRVQSDSFRAGYVNTWNPTGGPLGSGAWDGPAVPYRFSSPGYAVWDAFASWRINETVALQLNLNNVFDKRYYKRVDSPTTGNTWGEPFNGMLTLRMEL